MLVFLKANLQLIVFKRAKVPRFLSYATDYITFFTEKTFIYFYPSPGMIAFISAMPVRIQPQSALEARLYEETDFLLPARAAGFLPFCR